MYPRKGTCIRNKASFGSSRVFERSSLNTNSGTTAGALIAKVLPRAKSTISTELKLLVWRARLLHRPAHCSETQLHLPRDLSPGPALAAQLSHASSIHSPFEFRHRSDDLEHQAARWR